MPSNFVFANFFETELLEDISAEAGLLSVTPTMSAKLPIINETSEARLVLWDGVNLPEIVSVIDNQQTGQLSVLRAREGTSSRPWPAGTQVICALTAEVINSALQAYFDITAILNLNFLKLAGGTLTGPLILAADPALPLGAVTKQYADSILGAKLPLAGGTMLGPINMNGKRLLNLSAAIAGTEPARKAEVDAAVAAMLASATAYTDALGLAKEAEIVAAAASAATANAGVTSLGNVNRTRSGALTSGGTATAFTVTTPIPFASLAAMADQAVAFVPFTTNGQTVTLNVDGLGAKPLRASPGKELPAGVLIQGTPYVCTYNNTDGVFYLQDFYGNPFNVPLAGGMDFWGAVVPNSAFAFAMGQGLNTGTYSDLFAIMGYTYGGAGATFNLPDKSGRASVGREAAATRLTATYFGGNSTLLGANGGGESVTLVTGNLPPYTPAGGIVNGAITTTGGAGATATTTAVAAAGHSFADVGPAIGSTQAASTFNGTAQGGTSTPVRVVQPSIVCNHIIRVL